MIVHVLDVIESLVSVAPFRNDGDRAEALGKLSRARAELDQADEDQGDAPDVLSRLATLEAAVATLRDSVAVEQQTADQAAHEATIEAADNLA